MGFETRQSERFFVKAESSFADTSYTTFAATDAVLLEALSFSKKLNRTVSGQRSGTPEELVSQDARHTTSFQGNGLWAPSGVLGTASDYADILEGIMGDRHAANLSTTVASGGATTGAVLASLTGLQVGDAVVVTNASANGREPTRIKTMELLGQTPPIACVGALAAGGAGNVENGTHSYKVTFVNASGQTQLGAVSNTVTVVDKTSDGKVALTSIPLGPVGTTSRKVYRTAAAAAVTGPWKLLTTIADNTTTIYTDNTADASLGAQIANTVTWDTLTLAPATSAAVVSGVTYILTTAKPPSYALGIHETVEDEEEAVAGAVFMQATITLLDAGKPTLAFSGEASDYHTTGITTPTSATNTEVEITGLVGEVFVDNAAFTANQVTLTFGQGAKMMNRGIGVATPVDYIRNTKRTVRVSVDHYRNDYTIRDLAAATTRSMLRVIIGQVNGKMVGAILPYVEYELPDATDDDGVRAATIAGIGYGDITGTFQNSALTLFEA